MADRDCWMGMGGGEARLDFSTGEVAHAVEEVKDHDIASDKSARDGDALRAGRRQGAATDARFVRPVSARL